MKAAQRLERVRSLLAAEGLDAIVVRSVTDLMWLTGFEHVFDSEEAHTAVITADRCVLHSDSRYSTALRVAADVEGLWSIDDEPIAISAFVATVIGEEGFEEGRVAIDAACPLMLYRRYVEVLPDVTFVERSGDILALRAVKEAGEIDRIRAAQLVAERAFHETLEGIHPGQTERDVALTLEIALRRNGGDELAFPNIVASGPNSANPHAVPGERRLQRGDLVVIDFGARVDGYRSDTTRTICIGEPDVDQRRIYDAVRLANEEVERTLRAGVTGAQMHDLAERVLADAGFGGKMGHGLGHGVGLDIHESPNLSPRNPDQLEVGSVVTVEPGVYLAGSNGVRLEDFGVVTEGGFVNFCTLSHEIQVVE